MASLRKLVGEVKVGNEMAKGKPGKHSYMKFCASGIAHLCLKTQWFPLRPCSLCIELEVFFFLLFICSFQNRQYLILTRAKELVCPISCPTLTFVLLWCFYLTEYIEKICDFCAALVLLFDRIYWEVLWLYTEYWVE